MTRFISTLFKTLECAFETSLQAKLENLPSIGRSLGFFIPDHQARNFETGKNNS